MCCFTWGMEWSVKLHVPWYRKKQLNTAGKAYLFETLFSKCSKLFQRPMCHQYPSITEDIQMAYSLCHASFPLNHTERNGNIAQCLEQQHFVFVLWYLPQPFLLACFSSQEVVGRQQIFCKEVGRCPSNLQGKDRLLVIGQLVSGEPHQKVMALSSSSTLGFAGFDLALRKRVLAHHHMQGVGSVTAQLCRCHIASRIYWSPLIIYSNMSSFLERTVPLKYNSNDTFEITLPVGAEAMKFMRDWMTESPQWR